MRDLNLTLTQYILYMLEDSINPLLLILLKPYLPTMIMRKLVYYIGYSHYYGYEVDVERCKPFIQRYFPTVLKEWGDRCYAIFPERTVLTGLRMLRLEQFAEFLVHDNESVRKLTTQVFDEKYKV